MDVIKDTAVRFAASFELHALSLEKFDSELNSKLLYINKSNEKLRFLSYLRDEVESKYKSHAKVCSDPEHCGKNRSFEIALYSITQQYDDYYEMEGGKIGSERPAISFFKEGQYFDAYSSIREVVKGAKQSIVLIDGYVDGDTLAFFPGKEPNIKLRILTKAKSTDASFSRTIELYNKQYGNLQIKACEKFHDRFLILDDKSFYHIGASIKDAGRKVFMYSNIDDEDIKNVIRKKLLEEWSDVY